MNTLIFATNNQHKVDEIRIVLGDHFDIITLREAGIDIDIPEPHATLEANATEKSTTIYQLTNSNCFSEDTGLEIVALQGAPGVQSARYAGDARSFEANVDKVLLNMTNATNRHAQFRTVISLIIGGVEKQFEGICEGEILTARRGEKGFGYDPIFVPNGSEKAFAEMTSEEKNQFSHRQKAMTKLIEYLKKA